MAGSEEEDLTDLWEKNICPHRGKNIPEGKRIGTGKISQGGFCSLDCYASYYKLDLAERARLLRQRIHPANGRQTDA